ncbi:MAG: glycosyltransferase family 4 protein [Anaerolineae bacterium]|nr:glycosyltransferase family 4 protein [Anaerolineae bacterium]MCI0608133.1 glycosyltransferase family 4 protein [Anaerolineae bacterium]
MQNANHRPRVCINLPLAYPLFNNSFKGYFGGWEVRISLIARELAKRGRFEVVLIVGDYGQPHVESIDGVKLIPWKDRDIWGIPPRRNQNSLASWNPFPYSSIPYNIWHRAQKRFFSTLSVYFPGKIFSHVGKFRVLQKNIAIYDEINADIYIVPGNSFYSAETASYCSEQGKKYVFLSGSDIDYYPEFKEDPSGKDIYGMPHFLKLYCIQQADAHIVQTERQAKMLHDAYHRSCTVVKNPIDIHQKFDRNPNPQPILWVGKSDERVKRPSLVFELARRMPEFQFVVVMNTVLIKSHMESMRLAGELPNITLIEHVPFEEIESYFANARIHLNTSAFEGFPNTYLQAAKYGVPTVAMVVDPDGMLSHHFCGLVCGNDLDQCEESLRQLMTDDKVYAELSQNSLKYVRKYHDKDQAAQKYEQALEAVLSNGRLE